MKSARILCMVGCKMFYLLDLIGAVLVIGTMWRIAPRLISAINQPSLVDMAYPFQAPDSINCPMCGMNGTYVHNMDYCECVDYPDGHFHMECLIDHTYDGRPLARNKGCNFKWIMRNKSK